jgi:NAD(P)-dependent dehydrogenase (short-subunit alcohol dehydrogenase family)
LSSLDDLDGKTAVVTGAGRGIGRAIAERLGAAGALVVVNYATNERAAEDTVGAIEAAGGHAFAIRSVLGTTESVNEFVHQLATSLERRARSGIDILVNNVGGGIRLGVDSIRTTDEEALRRVFERNVFVPFLLTQTLLDRLNDDGRVINISSIATRLAGQQFAAYSMAKAALEMFTRILAKDLGPRGITVNSVGPGYTDTEVNQPLFADPVQSAEIIELTSLRRLGRSSDIADFVHALASSSGRWVTGQSIEASGGFRL